jgi:hypothetical protein
MLLSLHARFMFSDDIASSSCIRDASLCFIIMALEHHERVRRHASRRLLSVLRFPFFAAHKLTAVDHAADLAI